MPTNLERIAEYLNKNPGIKYDRQQIATELGLKPSTVSNAVSAYFSHRIGDGEKDKGKILPNDGFGDPIGAGKSRQPTELSSVKSGGFRTKSARKQGLYVKEDDRGSKY